MEDDHVQDAPRPGEVNRTDGQIDFGSYSIQQLRELQDILDRLKYPDNYRNLVDELTRREGSPPLAPNDLQLGRFTSAAGIRGWCQSKLARSPLYGFGSIDVGPIELTMTGWQRT